MTDAQRQASIKRHARFLTPTERQALAPTEAERRAYDRLKMIAKQTPGAWDRLRDAATFRHELNYGSGR